MDGCSSTTAVPTALEYSPEIDPFADRLVALLAQTPEYQEFTCLAQFVNLDPDVKQITMELAIG